MKRMTVFYRDGKEDSFTTNDSILTAAICSFCVEQTMWIEDYETRNGETVMVGGKYVHPNAVQRIEIGRASG